MKNESGSQDPQSKENEVAVTTPSAPMGEVQAVPGMALNIQAIMSQAISAGNVEMAEKVLNLYERMHASWAKEQFDKAMAQFQADCPIIEKTKDVKERDGKTVRYTYAPLDSIVEQTKKPIADNGLSYTIKVRHDDKMMTVIVKIKHVAGHSEDSEFAVPIGTEQFMSEPQKYGARCTFAKRYAFCNAFGILTGDGDTDAQEDRSAKQNQARPTSAQAAPQQKQAPNLIQTPLLNQVKIKLKKYGAKNETEALQMLQEKTGIKWYNMRASEKQAEFALKRFKDKEDEENKKTEKEIEVVPVEDLPNMVPQPAPSQKKNYKVSKYKIDILMGLMNSKKGYETEEAAVRYMNLNFGKSVNFPDHKIGSLAELSMEEADKLIKFMMTLFTIEKNK